jgi:hypothetical protein
MLAGERQQLGRLPGPPDNFEPGAGQQPDQALAQQHVVVGHHDPSAALRHGSNYRREGPLCPAFLRTRPKARRRGLPAGGVAVRLTPRRLRSLPATTSSPRPAASSPGSYRESRNSCKPYGGAYARANTIVRVLRRPKWVEYAIPDTAAVPEYLPVAPVRRRERACANRRARSENTSSAPACHPRSDHCQSDLLVGCLLRE